MSTAHQNLSDYNAGEVPSAAPYRFALITAEWNKEVTSSLHSGAIETLIQAGASAEHIHEFDVPGSFELTAAAAMAASSKKYDAIICLGCVVQGETKHFDFICIAVANGLSNISIQYNVPVIFGVLTTDTMMQAVDRSGGKHGNKGVEAAVTAIKMAELKKQFS